MQNKNFKTALIVLAMLLGSVFVLILSESVLMNSVPVMLSNNTKFNMIDSENEYLNYEGTWVIENEEHGTPLNSSNISCTKQTGKCIESRAYIFNNSLFVKTDTHQILSWDTNFIVFENDVAICAKYTYTIDVQKSQLNGIKEIRNTEKEICSNGLAGKNLKLKLVDGYDVWAKEREKKSFLFLNILLIGVIFVVGFFKIFKIYRN